MHILSILVVFGVLALAFGVIGAMLLGNSARIISALRGGDTRETRPVPGYPRISARRPLSQQIAANDTRTRMALAA